MTNDLFNLLDGLYEPDPEDEKEPFLRAPFNYMGSKLESLDFTLTKLPKGKVFVDGFGGSGIITLNRPKVPLEVFNDRESGITAFYKAIQEDPDKLIERIQLMPHSREFFIWCKETYNDDEDDFVRGAKWYYLVQCSFGGRIDKPYWGRVTKGKGNIYLKLENNLEYFDLIHQRFKSIQIENRSWEKLFEEYDSLDTVWYLDPPYYESNVYKCTMSKADHAKLCDSIFKLKGFVALAGFYNELYKQYPWDDVHTCILKNTIDLGLKENFSTSREECLFIKDFG